MTGMRMKSNRLKACTKIFWEFNSLCICLVTKTTCDYEKSNNTNTERLNCVRKFKLLLDLIYRISA